MAELGLPAVLKTAAWGYDGKGQSLVRTVEDARAAWRAPRRRPGDSRSVGRLRVRALDARGPLAWRAKKLCAARWPTIMPTIFSMSPPIRGPSWRGVQPTPPISPAPSSAQLDVVGLICVEFFLTRDGRLLVNEIAPRPHNSGHLTIDACACSQFEQQVRAVCGLPLGSFDLIVPAAAMANLLGDLWQAGEPQWTRVLADPRLRLHLYGKTEARPGRKMGHLTAIAATADEAAKIVRQARDSLVS